MKPSHSWVEVYEGVKLIISKSDKAWATSPYCHLWHKRNYWILTSSERQSIFIARQSWCQKARDTFILHDVLAPLLLHLCDVITDPKSIINIFLELVSHKTTKNKARPNTVTTKCHPHLSPASIQRHHSPIYNDISILPSVNVYTNVSQIGRRSRLASLHHLVLQVFKNVLQSVRAPSPMRVNHKNHKPVKT